MLVQYKAVVVTCAVLYLFVAEICQMIPYAVWCCKVEGGAFHFKNFACRDAVLVDGHIKVGIDLANHVLASRSGVANAGE